jgi:sugar-specific transcriptional regulator TrmB
MSQEEVLKTLSDFGLSRLDSKIYIYLAKKGPRKGKEISKALNVQKQMLYRSLKKLQSKAIVSATLERPARFSAVSFDKVLDLFIRAKLEEAQNIRQEKRKLLSSWKAIQTGAAPDTSARFMVIEGRNIIYSRIKQMINETKSQMSVISTVNGLVRADQFGLLDASLKNQLHPKIQFRVLTHLSENNVGALKTLLKETPKAEARFEIRNPNLDLILFPRMLIRDEEEVVFFINPKVDGSLPDQDNMCLWTNCKSLIQSFSTMFEDLWRNSTEIERKIAEIETGKPTPKTFVIRDAESIKKKYKEIMQSARKEIVLLTSSKGLIEYWKKMPQLEKWAKRSVSIKIMAPIVKENWEAMEQLSKFCTAKHVPIHYWGTSMVDGKHLFLFKKPQVELESTFYFDNAFYTNDVEWVETIKNALNDIWNSSQTPSATTLEPFTKPTGHPIFPLPQKDLRTKLFHYKLIDFKPPGTITEEDVLNKIIHGKRCIVKDPSKDIERSYGSYAFAVIHPPDQFNLPDMAIQVWKRDKKSSFGEGDDLTVYLWGDTPSGHAYIPVATILDNPHVPHPSAWGEDQAGTPVAKNFQLVKKDELQVLVHGNTMFAGWTVPIQLYPPNYVLPPACLLIEGYGDIRTTAFTLATPSDARITLEDNAFDAFVTFIHPASNYSGPGTDGILIRDSISTTIPP